jgi:hypothetical protein
VPGSGSHGSSESSPATGRGCDPEVTHAGDDAHQCRAGHDHAKPLELRQVTDELRFFHTSQLVDQVHDAAFAPLEHDTPATTIGQMARTLVHLRTGLFAYVDDNAKTLTDAVEPDAGTPVTTPAPVPEIVPTG